MFVVLSAWLVWSFAQPVATETPPTAVVLKDFVNELEPGIVTNALAASAGRREISGGVVLPGLFLHPQGAEDAVAAFDGVAVPDDGPVFLLFRLGMRDEIPWKNGSANGVRFSIWIDGTKVFEEVHSASEWTARAIDMGPYRGQTVSIAFHTNAIDSNTSYDWSIFGDPILVQLKNPASDLPAGAKGSGVLLTELEAAQPVDVTLAMGERATHAALSAGTHWLPLHFDMYEEPSLQVSGGGIAEKQRLVALYAPSLEATALGPSSPLVYAGEPFNVILTVRNDGRGTLDAGEIRLSDHLPDEDLAWLSDAAQAALPLVEPMAPGDERSFAWQGVTANALGLQHLGDTTMAVVNPPPDLPRTRPTVTRVEEVQTDQGPVLFAANAMSRLSLVTGAPQGAAYWIAECFNGESWQRLGTLFPWVRVRVNSAEGKSEELRCDIVGYRTSADSIFVSGSATDSSGRVWQIQCTATPATDDARIGLSYTLIGPEGGELLAFYGPSVLAGDKAFGVRKDFAIFPGLEYLEGDEPSSSTRDLAYPLSDRRVPAVYKIATPLMAVQGNQGLIALLWDANQRWVPDEPYPSARFNVPASESGYTTSTMALFAPSVGDYVQENHSSASTPYVMSAKDPVHLNAWLVLDHAWAYPDDSVVHGPHAGGLVLQAMQHYYDAYGTPDPSARPRSWDEELALCRDAYYHAVWHPDYPGWSHCYNWAAGDFVGHVVPLTLDLGRRFVDDQTRKESEQRIRAVLDHAIASHGPGYLWSGAGCHIMFGEVPFYYGHLAESMISLRDFGMQTLANREHGLWVWQPSDEHHATLGVPGDHTLGQAALGAYRVLRAARLTGDETLRKHALEAMKQMERYDVPRGAQMWECPLYQPDILAAAYAIRAYTEAYRLTGDPAHLAQARYWAWTGLPFLYQWEMPGYPTMRYNVISVIGSTFYSHSWIGLPVVWCGLVYAYALQDLAEFDDSYRWSQIAGGITNSAMWQQYADGPNRGTYPDSWNMVTNKPNPADINPENIMVNAFRLVRESPEIRSVRLDGPGGVTMINSSSDFTIIRGSIETGGLEFRLSGAENAEAYTLIAPLTKPVIVNLPEVEGSDALAAAPEGWHYCEPLRAVILKTHNALTSARVLVRW